MKEDYMRKQNNYDMSKLYSGVHPEPKMEYEVAFITTYGSTAWAYVYADDNDGAIRQAVRQGISRNSITGVQEFRKYAGYGRI